MCEFCIKHGEGEKWYLRMENYAADLRREKQVSKEIGKFVREISWKASVAEKLVPFYGGLPSFLKGVISAVQAKIQKDVHFGQVIPIEDTEEILKRMSGVVRLPCVCRRHSIKDEGRYCLGITLDPIPEEEEKIISGAYFEKPDLSNLEYMTFDEVRDLVREYDKKALVHTVWTLKTPCIIGICNCSPDSCLSLRFGKYGVKTLFKAEYVAALDVEKCVGCRACIEKCHFDALHFNDETKKVHVDVSKCYGCGLCRVPCPKGALSLVGRREHAVAANLWV